MFTRLFSLFSAKKPAPSRNIDVSKLFPVNPETPVSSDADASSDASVQPAPRKRRNTQGSYVTSTPSSRVRLR